MPDSGAARATEQFPDWVSAALADFVRANDPVPTVRTDALHLPLDLHGRLMSRYLVAQGQDPHLTFQQFIVTVLRDAERRRHEER